MPDSRILFKNLQVVPWVYLIDQFCQLCIYLLKQGRVCIGDRPRRDPSLIERSSLLEIKASCEGQLGAYDKNKFYVIDRSVFLQSAFVTSVPTVTASNCVPALINLKYSLFRSRNRSLIHLLATHPDT